MTIDKIHRSQSRALAFLRSIGHSGQLSRILRRIYLSVLVPAGFILLGTLGFHCADAEPHSLSDAFYMTIMTVTTGGYAEIVPMPSLGGRLFVGLFSIGGFGTLTFLFTTLSVFFLSRIWTIPCGGDACKSNALVLQKHAGKEPGMLGLA